MTSANIPGPYAKGEKFLHGRVDSPTSLLSTEADWPRIAALYEILAHLQPTPVVLLNRAAAVGFAGDPARGLRLADELRTVRALRAYPQLPAVRAELLARLGRADEARAEFGNAADLTRNASEQTLFRRRAGEVTG